jgi:GH15 family glucan-1,4-alpha-glucosidase
MYGIAGERRLTELELDWLPGYSGSSPVRIGNAAFQQLQIDVFGELMDTLFACNRFGLEANVDAWSLQTELLNFLEHIWSKPDQGLWESRGEPRHFTFSKIMAWVAFDRAVKSIDQYGFKGPRARWEKLRDRICEEVIAKGYDPKRNSFMQYYGSTDVDASLLLIPQLGFLPPEDSRVVGTIEAIERERVVDGLVMRYPTHSGTDGLPPGEGAFLVCTCWLANSLALIGRQTDAVALFERLLALRNDLGLLAEEYDPRAKRFLGNFPQAFSHIGIINTAAHLARVEPASADRGADTAVRSS